MVDEKSRKPSASKKQLENRLLRAMARGLISADDAFAQLYREYGRTVLAWLAVRTDVSIADDLAQDVWLIFYSRFRRWEFGTEMESPEARPVLSFLFRTARFVARAHHRLAATRKNEPLASGAERAVTNGQGRMLRKLEASRILERVHLLCPEDEVDVLLAKLSGMSAREIAKTLSITASVVDHRYRSALSRIRKAMKIERKKTNG
ncbi:MAG TPA: RNA polymerase sigma factor [Vicinamibacteria bacterium]|nr:RNA polymerase sigma factor [Vicinamibacteria bacterium]